jgi:hypothetical protein
MKPIFSFMLLYALCVTLGNCSESNHNLALVTDTDTTLAASALSSSIVSLPQADVHRKLATTVVLSSRTYSLMSNADVEASGICHGIDTYVNLDIGYSLAPDNADSQALIAAHGWGGNLVIVAGGNAYFSLNYALGPPGSFASAAYLMQIGNTYSVSACPIQILLVIHTLFSLLVLVKY